MLKVVRRLVPSVLEALVPMLVLAGCAGAPPPAPDAAPKARHLLLITIDTLRADRVGAYGYRQARTPTLDTLARLGTRFDRAFATAPITLTSHASLLTGLYPPGHGARHNGIALSPGRPTLAALLRDRGFATAAFVAAFPLDRRFGLDRGFGVYSDHLPRDGRGRPLNERPGREVADEAIAWLAGQQDRRLFLWVHFFEPHAPYGDPAAAGGPPASVRYDDEVAIADREAGRVVAALGARAADTVVVVAADHGESFGEHGEVGHSLFVYDTTLRVPLIVQGPGVAAGRLVHDAVTLADVAPTVMGLLGFSAPDTDGIDVRQALGGEAIPERELYAESLAPLLDFGWSPLRALRSGRWKAIAAPRAELYDVAADPAESRDLATRDDRRGATGTPSRSAAAADPDHALRSLLARIDRYGPAEPPPDAQVASADRATAARLASLGYLQGPSGPGPTRPDPKDRRELAARIAAVTSGEARGAPLLALLQSIVREDRRNGQMRLRLGDALVAAGEPARAEAHFAAAIAARVPSADPYVGLALCQVRRGAVPAALATLENADRVEPGNAVVHANIGLLEAQRGRLEAAIPSLQRALDLDADFHEARFNLAIVLARAGRPADAGREARELLRRLPPDAPQRREVERLLRTVAPHESDSRP